jgi:hypothetical protein
MMKRLTAKHDQFVVEYIKSGFIGPSYRKVFGNKSDNGARVNGCRLMKQPLIIERIEQVRARMAKRSDITIEKILTDYQDAMALAREQGKANEIVMAATAQAKLVGLLRDRVETGAAGEFDALDNMSQIVEKIAAEAGPEAAVAFMAMFNRENPDEGTDAEAEAALVEMPAASEAKN